MVTSGLRRWRTVALASGLLMSGGVPLCALAHQAAVSEFQPCPAEYHLPAQFAERAQCATLTVPENRAAPKARTLTLPIVKLPASDPKAGVPIFVLNGGPGEPNLSLRPLVQVNQKHDVLYVGYRGADGSTVLTCPEVNAELQAADHLLSDATLKKLGAAGAACAERLTKSGIDLSRYTILDVIDDLETTRSALGYEKINLLSVSYGTRVAQYYARRHPQRIFRSVMWGANPPGHFVFSTRVNDQILSRLSQLCAADAYCSSKTDDLQHTILHALHGAEQNDAAVDDGKSRVGLFYTMYRRESFRDFAEAAIAAEHGDWSSLNELGTKVSTALENVIWGDLISKGCVDVDRYAGMEPTFATTATSMGSPSNVVVQAIAAQWPRTRLPAQYERAALDPTQTLVINGDIDIATPLVFVEAELMPYLPNGKLLALKDYGHGDFGRQARAFDRIIATYYATGQLDASGLQQDPYSFSSKP